MRTGRNIPRHLQEQVDREIESGERIEWIDMPIPRFFMPYTRGEFLFGILWTAFAIFWTCSASGFKIPDFKEGSDLLPLFGIPFILSGLSMMSSPLRTYRKSFKTVYVVTNKRAIIFDGGGSTATISSYPPEKLQDIYRREKRDGSGDVVVACRAWHDSEGERQTDEIGFFRISNPKEIEQLLKKLADQAAGL